ncbi:uncharacterized protein LOC141853279 [Brevipalpus obovatus]|uniref:uncharacterized protein LOC141853279 n=1 Tax=Brevipalpus obovatus TaxID=246614 RepID=UPI003D9E1690
MSANGQQQQQQQQQQQLQQHQQHQQQQQQQQQQMLQQQHQAMMANELAAAAAAAVGSGMDYGIDPRLNQTLVAQYQNFLNTNAPTLVMTSSNIPLYPGCNQGAMPVPNQTNSNGNSTPKYTQLLAVFEEMNKDIRPIYAGSKTAAERFKRGILYSRLLIKDLIDETKK